jgi:flagellar basal body L-ring protein FlgH
MKTRMMYRMEYLALLLMVAALCGCQKKPQEPFQPTTPTKTMGAHGPQRIPPGARPPQTPVQGANR